MANHEFNVTDDLRKSFAKKVAFPLADHFHGFGCRRKLELLRSSQYWTKDQTEQYQLKALQSLVETAYQEIPLFRNLMDQKKLQPSSIRHISDICLLPILTKDLIRKNYPQRTTRSTPFRQHEVSSSGSTGTNLVVLEDSDTTGILYSCHLFSLEMSGWTFGDRHLQFGMSLERGFFKTMKDRLLGCSYVSGRELRDEEMDSALNEIENQQIHFVHGYAGSLYRLASRALETKREIKLRAVSSWGDNLYAHYRRSLEKAFQTKVYDSYGCAEGITVAAQCGHENNYHLYSPFVLVEVVDDSGQPLPPGQSGHLLLTRLQAGAMPLIRYRVEDRGMLGDHRECPCGRRSPLMLQIEGRDTDIVMTRSGNHLIVHFFTGIFEYFHEIKNFQVVQRRPGHITIYLVPSKEITSAALQKMQNTLYEAGADLEMEFEVVTEIPCAKSGKRRFVINEWKRQNHAL